MSSLFRFILYLGIVACISSINAEEIALPVVEPLALVRPLVQDKPAGPDVVEIPEELIVDDLVIRVRDPKDVLPEENTYHNGSGLQVEDRIVGGAINSISNLKYLVAIGYNTNYIGAGTLISPSHVLTTAYLIRGLRPGLLRVRGGSSLFNSGGVIQGVLKTVIPKLFSVTTYNMDVGLMRLNEPLTGPNISPIGRCSNPLRVGNSVQISGWGAISGTRNVLSPRVRSVNVPIISRNQCQRIYSQNLNFALRRSMFCTSTAQSKGVCVGDTGGPLIFNNEVCGLISIGVGCVAGYPDVYTLLNAHEVKNFVNKALFI